MSLNMNLRKELIYIMGNERINMAEYNSIADKCRLAAGENKKYITVYNNDISQRVIDKLKAEGLTVEYSPAKTGWDPLPQRYTISWL